MYKIRDCIQSMSGEVLFGDGHIQHITSQCGASEGDLVVGNHSATTLLYMFHFIVFVMCLQTFVFADTSSCFFLLLFCQFVLFARRLALVASSVASL